jgi:hypothetical protein
MHGGSSALGIASAHDTAAPTRIKEHHIPIRFLNQTHIATPERPAEVSTHPFNAKLELFKWAHFIPTRVTGFPYAQIRSFYHAKNGFFSIALAQIV